MPKPSFSVGAEARQGIWILVLITSGIVAALSFTGKGGEFGEAVNTICVQLLGSGKWALPIILGFTARSLTGRDNRNFNSANIAGLFLFLISFSSLLYFYNLEAGGGTIGKIAVEWLLPYIGAGVGAVLFSTGIIIGLLLLLNTSLSRLLGKESIVFKILALFLGIILSPFIKRDLGGDADYEKQEAEIEEKKNKKAVVKEYDLEEEGEDSSCAEITGDKDEKDSGNATDHREDPLLISRSALHIDARLWPRSNIDINFPFSLLKNKPSRPTSGNIDRNQDVIKRTLKDFGIPINMGEVMVGPTVTQYTFKPANGIPVARVKALSDDLALNLALHPVRIEAPIPGKPLVGLEVPNQTKVLVTLKEVLQSKKFKNRKSSMTIALGRDVTGRIWFDDLAKLPHLLVAGATNSGKSICLHSLITSLLYQNNPDDLKFILIDLKQVELTVYNSLPYLIAPVVTENTRAIRALGWCLGEMERRLEILSKAGTQNIHDYNKKKLYNRMPYLVVVVDELGDLLATNRREAEGAIIRLGQKARAAGIHMILATQRPSVDILSGLIKANMPGRIAFQVTSSINSRTILDSTGAEKLLGQGDMLYINPQLAKPIRIQGAYISKDEIKAVVRHAKRRAGKAKYLDEVTERSETRLEMDEEVGDDMLEEAKRMILEAGKASASMLQSRLAIGYPRANRILDILEKRGVVGPSIQNKPREVLKG